MAIVRFICVGMLASAFALAQSQPPIAFGSGGFNGTTTYYLGNGSAGIATGFNLAADPPYPRPNISSGSSTIGRGAPGTIGGHRYFYDSTNRVYFGYDFLIQPGPQPDTYSVSIFELSMSPLDFVNGAVDPTQWKKVPLPAIPAPQVVKTSDAIPVSLYTDPTTGQKLTDTISLQPTQRGIVFPQGTQFSANSQALLQQMQQQLGQMQFSVRGGMPAVRSAPTVSGPARDFSVEDAEMRLAQASVKINGAPQQFPSMASRGTSGPLIWFYLPQRGRFVLSLAPRPELGFVKAGEVRGGVITFTIGKDELTLESPTMIASGDAAYILYVLHDPEWAPTAQGQVGQLLVGSVSRGELAALTRK